MTTPFRRTDESTLLDSIIKEAQEQNWKERFVINPATGNKVKVKSLPSEEQKRYHQEELSKHKKDLKDTSDKIDKIVSDDGRVNLNDPLSIKTLKLRNKIKKLKQEKFK